MTNASFKTVDPSRRVVGYVRVSRNRDSQTSTITQEEQIRAWCGAHGHTLVRLIVEPGRSAFKASRRSRPGLREAMQLIRTGAADAFVCWKIDRAARNTFDLLTFVEELKSHGAEFVSVTEDVATDSASGDLLLALLGALAQMESAQKSDRASEWHRHRRLNGAVPAGPAALGYVKPAPNKLVPDPDVAPHVAEAARLIADGASVLAALRMMHDNGVKVTHVGLKVALQSPTIAGLVAVSSEALPRRGGVRQLADAELEEGDWEPIVDRDLWERVGEVLGDPSRRTNSTNQLRWPIVPIARCHCGSRMRHHFEKYRTKGGTRELGRLLCLDQSCLNGIAYDGVEAAVTADVLGYLDGGAWNTLRAAAGNTQAVAEAVAAAESKLDRLWKKVLDGVVDPEEYAEAKARWMGEGATSATDPVALPNVADVRAAWPDLTAQERHLVFRAAIERLVIKPATRRGGRGMDPDRIVLELV
jgi:DNA invertase Pin-like site-specific DNA recombinase